MSVRTIKLLGWRLTLEKEPPSAAWRWKLACKHGIPNFVHCRECDKPPDKEPLVDTKSKETIIQASEQTAVGHYNYFWLCTKCGQKGMKSYRKRLDLLEWARKNHKCRVKE